MFAWATVLGPGSLGFLFIPYLSPAFDRWEFWAVAGSTLCCAVAFLLLYEHFRRRDTRDAIAAGALSGVA